MYILFYSECDILNKNESMYSIALIKNQHLIFLEIKIYTYTLKNMFVNIGTKIMYVL